MTGPFHAIGMLRPNLTQSAFGSCVNENSPTTWKAGGTLDVIRGLNYRGPKSTQPIVFPGDGATLPLNRFITEYPNPMTLCGWGGTAGLPLIAMMPNGVSGATSSLVGPSGPVQTCTLHQGNTGANATAQAILRSDNAVVVMPRDVLANGTYTATVDTPGGSATWSFTIDNLCAARVPAQAARPDPGRRHRARRPAQHLRAGRPVPVGRQQERAGHHPSPSGRGHTEFVPVTRTPRR